MRLKPIAVSFLFSVFPAFASPSISGTSGIINMPDARVGDDGTFSVGYSYDRPYASLWTALTLLPNLQMTGRFVGIRGTSGFSGNYQESYGSYKDKVIDLKLRLLEEGRLTPAVVYGRNDIFGTGLFEADYVALSKQIGPLDTIIGYGRKRLDGPFGGVRWTLPYDKGAWSLLAEYDTVDYKKDFRADETYAGKREGGPVFGVEYRWGWLGAKLTRSRDHSSINTYINIPFDQKEFVPKIFEPASYATVRVRPSESEWKKDSSHSQQLLAALHKQDYKSVGIAYQRGVLHLDLSNTRINNIGRAIGRAVRTALYFAPVETRAINVRYQRNDLPIAEYEFFDLNALSDYLNKKMTREKFREFVLVKYAGTEPRLESEYLDVVSASLDEDINVGFVNNEDGKSLQLRGTDSQNNNFSIAPKVAMYFNDPSGAFRYEVNAQASSQLHLGTGQYLDSALTYKVIEDVSKVQNPSNSLLPHVRTDVAEYKRGNPFRLNQLAYTHLFQPGERFYGKFSAGIFEEMFGGVAGQLVYFPPSSRWMAELTTEAVQQRDYNGWFGRRDYKTVTGLLSLHYKLPLGVSVTGRVGRFLAKDNGVRVEFKRRFNSGIEAGAWYTYTDGKDTTSPGTPSSPYHDRGLFMSIPFDSMLPADTQSGVKMSIAPWTRDVGQIVDVPRDLVRQLEDPVRQMALDDGLGNIAEHPEEVSQDQLPDPAWWPSASGVRMRLSQSAGGLPEVSDAAIAAGASAALLAGVVSQDKAIDDKVTARKNNKLLETWSRAGSAAPVVAVGLSGLAMGFSDDPVLVNTAVISLQSAALALGASMGVKKMTERARPQEAKGKRWTRSARGDSSFTSNHAVVTFAAVTPYAETYRQPWLYAAAGLASAGRVAGHKHWASDVVVGSLLGYGTGYWLWRSQKGIQLVPQISDGGKNIGLALDMQY